MFFLAETNQYVANPTEFIHIFLKNSPQLITFLEYIHSVSKNYFLSKQALNTFKLLFEIFFLKNHISNSKIIGNTLLELYINTFSDPNKDSNNLDEAKSFLENVGNYRSVSTKSVTLKEKRALEFLTNNYDSYDMNLALIICQLHNFRVSLFLRN